VQTTLKSVYQMFISTATYIEKIKISTLLLNHMACWCVWVLTMWTIAYVMLKLQCLIIFVVCSLLIGLSNRWPIEIQNGWNQVFCRAQQFERPSGDNKHRVYCWLCVWSSGYRGSCASWFINSTCCFWNTSLWSWCGV